VRGEDDLCVRAFPVGLVAPREIACEMRLHRRRADRWEENC
jgi:hypothetical protein